MKKTRRKTKADVTLGLMLTALVLLVVWKRAGMGSKITNTIKDEQPSA
jgi:hypothetical protein